MDVTVTTATGSAVVHHSQVADAIRLLCPDAPASVQAATDRVQASLNRVPARRTDSKATKSSSRLGVTAASVSIEPGPVLHLGLH